ncbi:MAG: 2-amino-4-hydroxy-6-hydroxymethyldihydropteridine diphosphokinase [Spirochaetes bacterium]|jgi:2-amino-4-hydroxy-6-hydroxymethyldihydropteridine diphosphokinase|nr:2-amino-4-hydroxy-6-hydroxymethyldihydropteridine diphosphokinase [Spirochaetota bacterium]
MAIAFVGLGSNIGDRAQNLSEAERLIQSDWRCVIISRSSTADTEPVDYIDQPRFLNRIIRLSTMLAPADLLGFLKGIEKKMGRKPSLPKGPRLIDLDILLYENIVMETDDLILPHPAVKNRRFILDHLVEIEPELADPKTKKKYAEIISQGGGHAIDKKHQ